MIIYGTLILVVNIKMVFISNTFNTINIVVMLLSVLSYPVIYAWWSRFDNADSYGQYYAIK